MLENQISISDNENTINIDLKDSKYATGRRKKSIARVWVKKGSGLFSVNGKKLSQYFRTINHVDAVMRPLEILKRQNEFDIKCTVKGGGPTGQTGAIILGISRALIIIEPNLKKILKKEKLTTRDPRAVERKKYGRRKARRSFQFSKR